MSSNPRSSSWLTGINVCLLLLSILLTTLDLTIVSTAVPRISHEFHSLNNVGWYGAAFFLTMAISQSIWGKIYRFCDVKWSFLTSLLIFELGTLGSAVSKGSTGFTVGRAVAGAGGGGIIGGTYVIIANIVPAAKVPMFYGLSGVVFTIASVMGPLAGGALTDYASWRWCFYINLPIGGLVGMLLIVILRLPETTRGLRVTRYELLLSLDLPGCLSIIGCFICYTVALQTAGIDDKWSSPQSVGLLVASAVLGICFAVIEFLQGHQALIAPHHLRDRGILICSVFVFCLNAANYIRLYYMPIYFQAVHGSSPAQSGVLILPLIVPTSVVTIIAGALLGKVGYYQPFLLVGGILATVGSGLTYALGTNFSLTKSIVSQLIAGIGDGIACQIPVTVVQAFAPAADLPIVTATVLFFQLGSGVIGVAAGESIFANQLLKRLSQYTLPIDAQDILHVGASQLTTLPNVNSDQLSDIQQSYAMALRNTLALSIGCCGLACVFALFAPMTSILGLTGVCARQLEDQKEAVKPDGDEVEKPRDRISVDQSAVPSLSED